MLQLIIFGLEQAIADAPGLIAEFQAIFANNNLPTAQDWTNLREAILSKNYASFDPKPLPPGVIVNIPSGLLVGSTTAGAPALSPAPAPASALPNPNSTPEHFEN